jgi:hypothetical protein
MIIDESFYGRFELEEPLLLDLLQSDPVQRLKGVYMGGVTSLLGVGTTSTRYEHSVGAMLLVRLLGASQEEQAAALLHDVSHTALSHVIDYVFDTPSRQAFHDDIKEQYVSGTAIPGICEKYEVDWRALLDEGQWTLLEQPAPGSARIGLITAFATQSRSHTFPRTKFPRSSLAFKYRKDELSLQASNWRADLQCFISHATRSAGPPRRALSCMNSLHARSGVQ